MALFRRKIKVIVFPPALLPLLIFLFMSGYLVYHLFAPFRPAAIYYGFPLKERRILIDPGHGGIDPGTHYNHNGLREKEVVLAVGLELRRLLVQAGAEVIMTRETDEDVSRYIPGYPASRYQRDLEGRVKLINESKADLFVSLHVNYIYDPTIRGAIIFYCRDSPKNKLLAEAIQDSLNPVVFVNPRPGQYFHQKIQEGNYRILNSAVIPGVIVELGFMSNPDDRELLTKERYREELAQAILLGIAAYLFGR